MTVVETLLKKNVKVEEWGGDQFRLRKLGASAHIELKNISQKVATDSNEADLVKFFALVLSKTLCDENGKLEHDTAEGRDMLASLTLPDLMGLGDLALKWNGIEAKAPETEPPAN